MSSPSSSGNDSASAAVPLKSLIFDYTKRKRWMDQMTAELGADSLVFAITPTTKVVYCTGCAGAALDDPSGGLASWSDADFIGSDLTDFINPEDLEHFHADFRSALRTNEEQTTYARLRPQPSPSILPPIKLDEIAYELRLTPHQHPEDPALTVIVVFAKQIYLSRFIDSKLVDEVASLVHENTTLQGRLEELRALIPPELLAGISIDSGQTSDSVYSSSNLTNQVVDTGMDSGADVLPLAQPAVLPGEDLELDEGGGRKKRAKRSHGIEQYVCITCGRTNSPEWRKGPLGPKTLCNACGLRWAKLSKKTDDSTGQGGKDGSTEESNSGTPESNSPS